MTRLVCLGVLAIGVGCNGPGKPTPQASAPVATWVGSVKPWYCGAEPLAPKAGPDGASTPQVRDVALKIVPTEESFTVVYAAANGNDKSVGSMTRFSATGDRTATLRWENDQRQKGDTVLAFSPDYSTVTVTWAASATPPGSSPVPPGPTTLLAAAGASGCVAGSMIR